VPEQTLIDRPAPSRFVLGAAALVVLLGTLALVGWALGIDPLTRVVPGLASMKPNTALCMVLAGAVLAGLGWTTGRRRGVTVVAGVLLAIALASLVQDLTGLDLAIDERLFRDPDTHPRLHPGRMAIATAVGLLLVAATVLLTARAPRHPTAGRVARVLGGGVVTIGVLALLGPALHVIFLHSWYAFGSVALPTAVAFVLLGLGLLVTARQTWAPRPISDDRRITEAAALALILAAGTTGLVGVAALEMQIRRSVEGELRSLLSAHLAELTANLDLRATRAAIVTTRPNMLRHLRLLVATPANQESRQVVRGVLDSFLPHGFSMLVATLPDGAEAARTGADAGPGIMNVALDGPQRTRLIWRDGLFLRQELALADAQGPLGTVVAEQRMPRLTAVLTGDQTHFARAEFLLCGRPGTMFRCFPSRLSAAPIMVSPGTGGEPRLAQLALTEGAGAITTVDYRGHQVLGAYAPLPDFGLVAVLKVDTAELYGPVRRQLALALVLVAGATVAGVGLLRWRVGSLAGQLEQRVQDRTADLDRVNARLRILHEIDRGLITAQAPAAVAESALRPLQALLQVPRATVNLFDFEAGEAEWLAGAGRRQVRVGPGVRFPLALMGDLAALRRGEVQTVDVRALPPSPDTRTLLASGVQVYQVVPMIAGGELIGSLGFGGAPGELSPEQIGIAREVATQLAIVIGQARLRDRIRQQAEELEQRVEERTRELSEANAQLQHEIAERRRAETEAERANQAKSEFLSRMSHELRTPLNAILGFGQLLEMERPDPRQRESTEQILRAGRHLLRLIDEVLDIARIEAGGLRLSLEPVPLPETIRDATELMSTLARDRRIDLRVDDVPAGLHVMADRQRLQQVLLNLLSNGVKYTPPGGAVTVSCATLPASRVQVRVTDTGVGIAPDKIGRLFTAFDRLGAETGDIEGTGLGLTLSKHLVEAMGGVLRVDSGLGVGSTFSVELSLAEAAVQALPRPWPAVVVAATSEVTAVILYIEDNLSNLRLVERILDRRPGIKLLSAMQGRVGIDLAREHRPDLILLDQHLPDMEGDAVIRVLKDDARTSEIPIVVLSADASPRQVQRLREAGVRDYLTKPLDVGRLLALIDETLAAREGT